MNQREVAELLTVVSAFDNRTLSAETVVAWSALLGDVSLSDAMDRAKKHYQSSTRWLMPADLRESSESPRAVFCPVHEFRPHPDSVWGCDRCAEDAMGGAA